MSESIMYIQLALRSSGGIGIGAYKAFLGYFAAGYEKFRSNPSPWYCKGSSRSDLEKENENLRLVRKRVIRTTAGLLEIVKDQSEDEDESENERESEGGHGDEDHMEIEMESQVGSEARCPARDPSDRCAIAWEQELKFIHRTARDFFLNEAEGRGMLQHYPLNDIELFNQVLDAFLRAWRMGIQRKPNTDEITDILGHLKDIEGMQGTRPSSDQFMAQLSHIETSLALLFSGDERDKSGKWPTKVPKSVRSHYASPLDFLGMTLLAGFTDYLEGKLGRALDGGLNGKPLSQRDKDCLLLCSSARRFWKNPLESISKLLDMGGDPNAALYLAKDFPLKNTPFLEYARSVEYSGTDHDECYAAFIRSGARPGDYRITAYSWLGNGFAYHRDFARVMINEENEHEGLLIVIFEVNGAYYFKESSVKTDQPDCPNPIEWPIVQPHRRVLLVRPGIIDYEDNSIRRNAVLTYRPPREYAEIQPTDSQLVEDLMLKVSDEDYFRPRSKIQERCEAYEAIIDICNRSPKVILEEYLEQKGYYKKPGDPEVRTEPILL